jgi:penicillin-binding protein 1C
MTTAKGANESAKYAKASWRILRAFALMSLLMGVGTAVWMSRPLPAELLAPAQTQSLTIEDRSGALLRTTRAGDGSLARWVTLQQMDPDLPRAFVAVEDRRFYRHHGVDPRSIVRALRDNVLHTRVVSGASTITMQLARLVRPLGRRWSDKVVQALWALRIDAHLSKNEILEQYLNRVPLGQGSVGVAAAMRLYFGGDATQASVGQAAMLAALARAPSSRNPLVDPAGARLRRTVGLRALAREGYASAEEIARAGQEPLVAAGRGRPFLAPHFTSRLLGQAEGLGRPLRGSWRTSLDAGLQDELEREVRHTIADLADRTARHAAVVVLENATGQILAYVGSPDFWADTAGQVDMVSSERQPGSALKPFLYALAFDRGATPATVLADIATTYQTSAGPYHPRNYDRRYHGPVRAREALGSSYNVPAVELANRIGYATLLHGLHDAGFASLRRSADHYGLGLALGNGDVTLLELANGYRALARGGVWSPVQWWAGQPEATTGTRIVSSQSAALVLDILTDPVARIPAFGLRTPFDWPFRAAAKTGTSRHYTDNWAVATIGRFTVAVWVGNFSGQPMQGVSGVTGAGPLLHRAVLVTAQRYAPGTLIRPEDAGLVAAQICRVSGLRASHNCPTMTEWFRPGTIPTATCHWHGNGEVHLPAAYAEWEATEGGSAATRLGDTRTEVDVDELPPAPDSRAAEPPSRRALAGRAAEPFRITSPANGDRYRIPPGVDSTYATVALRASGGPGRGAVRWYADDQAVTAERWQLRSGTHTLRAVGEGVSDEVTITVD